MSRHNNITKFLYDALRFVGLLVRTTNGGKEEKKSCKHIFYKHEIRKKIEEKNIHQILKYFKVKSVCQFLNFLKFNLNFSATF